MLLKVEIKPVGYWKIAATTFKIAAYSKPRWLHRFLMHRLLGILYETVDS